MFKFLDERNPDIWKESLDKEKSGNLARYGTAEPPTEESDDDVKEGEEKEGEKEKEAEHQPRLNRGESDDSDATKTSRSDGAGHNEASGVKVDPEKGRDLYLIDFLPNDPEVCTNLDGATNTVLMCLRTLETGHRRRKSS